MGGHDWQPGDVPTSAVRHRLASHYLTACIGPGMPGPMLVARQTRGNTVRINFQDRSHAVGMRWNRIVISGLPDEESAERIARKRPNRRAVQDASNDEWVVLELDD